MKQLSFRHGWRSARLTLGWQWPATALLAGLALLLGAAMLEAQNVTGECATRAAEADLLRGVTFGLLLPLSCFALSARLDTGLEALMRAIWVRHGAERRAYALGRLAFPMALTGGIALIGGSLALALSNAASDPALELPIGLGTNGVVLFGVAVLGAVSYMACLGLAQMLAGAWGRALFLLADWLLGSGAGAAAVVWPRAHLRALLGGEPVLQLSALASTGWLVLLSAACLFLYLRRVPH
jgi:hypothetical protein